MNLGFSAEENSTLNRYMREIREIPLLDPMEEIVMGLRAFEGDRKAVLALVRANLRLVVSVAKKYAKNKEVFLDLINEGNLGLFHAAELFDPHEEVRFSSYATWWIRKFIFKFMNTGPIVIPDRKSQALIKVKKARAEIIQHEHREPSLAELAKIGQVDEKALANMFLVDGAQTSLDALPTAAPYPSGEEAIEKKAISEELHKAIGRLSEKERIAIELYFGLLEKEKVCFQTIGDAILRSREGARLIVQRALDKLSADPKIKSLR